MKLCSAVQANKKERVRERDKKKKIHHPLCVSHSRDYSVSSISLLRWIRRCRAQDCSKFFCSFAGSSQTNTQEKQSAVVCINRVCGKCSFIVHGRPSTPSGCARLVPISVLTCGMSRACVFSWRFTSAHICTFWFYSFAATSNPPPGIHPLIIHQHSSLSQGLWEG